VVFSDERALVVDAVATEALRAKLRAGAAGSSLTEYYAERGLPPAPAAASSAGNVAFGMA